MAVDLQQLADLFPLLNYRPYNKQLEFHKATNKRRLFVAGNRAGKTTAGAAETLWRVLNIHPYNPDANRDRPQNGWVIAVDFPVLHSVILPLFMQFLPPADSGIWKWYEAKRLMAFSNGSTLWFKSGDSPREKFQSASIDFVWFDEEPFEDVYNECMARTIDRRGVMWMTMTPLHGMSWTYKKLYALRDTHVTEASMYDNPYLDREEIEDFKSRLSDWETKARIYGKFAAQSGSVIKAKYLERLTQNAYTQPLYTADVRLNRSIHRFDGGRLAIYEDPAPNTPYIIGADIGSGSEHGDPTVINVTNALSLNDAAEWRGYEDPDIIGSFIIPTIAKHYNNATVAVETNSYGAAAERALEQNYHNFFVDHSAAPDPTATIIGGIATTVRTRPIMISLIQQLARLPTVKLAMPLIDELAAFHISSTGKFQAKRGCQDDRVIAKMLALYAHNIAPAPQPRHTHRHLSHRHTSLFERILKPRKARF